LEKGFREDVMETADYLMAKRLMNSGFLHGKKEPNNDKIAGSCWE